MLMPSSIMPHSTQEQPVGARALVCPKCLPSDRLKPGLQHRKDELKLELLRGYNGGMASRSHRRDFLAGKSAAEAARDLVDRIAGDEAPLPTPTAISEPTLLVHYARPAMGTRFEVYL